MNMIPRDTLERLARLDMRFLLWKRCQQWMTSAERKQFHLYVLLVGQKLDMRCLSDAALLWLREMYQKYVTR